MSAISTEALSRLPRFLVDLLDNCPAAGDGVHFWIYRVARHLLAHFDDRSTFELIKEKAAHCGRPRAILEREIVRQIQGAHAHVWRPKYPKAFPHGAIDYSLPPLVPPPAWPKADIQLITSIVNGGPMLVDLVEWSPVRFGDGPSHAEEIIDVLFPGNPLLCVGKLQLLCVGKSQFLFAVRRREVWRGHLARLPLIVPSPMLDYIGRTADGRLSEHTKENTGRRVYLVEFDFSEFGRDGKTPSCWAPLVREWRSQGKTVADVCAALHMHLATRLPLVCVTHSAGKSIHAWFLAFGQNEADLRRSMDYAVSLGADHATWTRSQFVRYPGGLRENGKRQRCLYLDPGKAVRS